MKINTYTHTPDEAVPDPGGQDPLCGAPVEGAEYPGVHVEPPQPAEEEDLLSGCLCDGVGVVSPGQVLM